MTVAEEDSDYGRSAGVALTVRLFNRGKMAPLGMPHAAPYTHIREAAILFAAVVSAIYVGAQVPGTPQKAVGMALALLALTLAARIEWRHLAIAAVAIASLPIPVTALGFAPSQLSGVTIAAVLVSAVWLHGALAHPNRGSPMVSYGADARVVLVLPVTWIALAVIAQGRGALTGAAPILFALLAALLCMRLVSLGTSIRKVVSVLAVGAVALSAIDLIQSRMGRSVVPGIPSATVRVLEHGRYVERYSGSLGDYELLAEFLSVSIVLTVWLAMTAGTRMAAFKWVCAILPLLSVLLLTGTRSALILLAPAVVALAMLTLRRVIRVLVWGCAVATAGAVLFVCTGSAAPTAIIRLESVYSSPSLAYAINREYVWEVFESRTRANQSDLTYLIGHGLTYPFSEIGTYPHSLYRYALYTVGVIGLAALIGTLLWLLGSLAKHWRRSRTPTAALFITVIGMLLTDGVKIELLRVPAYVLFVGCIIGLAISVRSEGAQDDGPTTRSRSHKAIEPSDPRLVKDSIQ